MPDEENDPFPANAPATESGSEDEGARARATFDGPGFLKQSKSTGGEVSWACEHCLRFNAPEDKNCTNCASPRPAPPTDALAVKSTPAGASALEATDAAQTAPKTKPKKKSDKQRRKEATAASRAARPKPIPTPVGAMVAIKPGSKMQGAGLVCKVEIDNSQKTSGQKKGYIYIVDSTGEKKWVRPGAVVDASAYKDKFEVEEKKSGGKPYMLGGDDDASESNGDEPLEKPPVAKDVEIATLGTTSLRELHKYVEGSCGDKGQEECKKRRALLRDVSEEKADERAALVKRLGKTVKDAWAKYEKHREKYPDLYQEEEVEAAPKDYSDVDIDHVKLPQYLKDTYRKLIQECVAERVDLSSVEAMPASHIQKSDFLKALRDARGESRDQQRSPRLAGGKAPALPTCSMPGQHGAYNLSVDAEFLRKLMVGDAHALVRDGSLVPAVGANGWALRGGFDRGLGLGCVFRIVGVPGSSFQNRFDRNAVFEYDPVEAVSSSLQIDLKRCFKPSEWDELESRLVYGSKVALEALPDETSVKEQAKAVYGAICLEVEKFEHEAV